MNVPAYIDPATFNVSEMNAVALAACPNDTNGDGSCHKCAKLGACPILAANKTAEEIKRTVGDYVAASKARKAEMRERVLSAAFDHITIHGDDNLAPSLGEIRFKTTIRIGKRIIASSD